MSGRFEGKVAVVSGAARGMGRSHAQALAAEGADLVLFDVCEGFDYVLAPPATEADLAETARLVEATGRECLARRVDARDLTALQDLADAAMERFGRIDIVVVNHGIWVVAPNSWELEEANWQESIDVLLTGAWKVTKAFVPKLIEGGRGGSIILTSSVNAHIPQPSAIAYTAAKHGLTGVMKVLAHELGEHWIRVNNVNPAGVPTPMVIEGDTVARAMEFRPDYISNNRSLLPEDEIPVRAITNAVLWLASEDSRYVTGTELPVDAGWAIT